LSKCFAIERPGPRPDTCSASTAEVATAKRDVDAPKSRAVDSPSACRHPRGMFPFQWRNSSLPALLIIGLLLPAGCKTALPPTKSSGPAVVEDSGGPLMKEQAAY